MFTYQQNKDKIQIVYIKFITKYSLTIKEIIAAEIDKLNNVKTFMIEPDKSLVEILLIVPIHIKKKKHLFIKN